MEDVWKLKEDVYIVDLDYYRAYMRHFMTKVCKYR